MNSDIGIPVPPQIVGNYKLLEKLGKGGFSVVYKAIHIPSNTNVAIKVINKTKLSEDKLDREISLMKKLDHPFAISFFEFLSDQDFYYLVMEDIEGGNLLWLINRQGPLPEAKVHRYYSQLITVLDYIHNSLKIAHRDLKAENIMLDVHDNIRLIDFGLSNQIEGTNGVLSTQCGSPSYAPPEMFRGKPYSTLADVWSSGVVLYVMSYGKLPFDDENVHKLASKIVLDDPIYPNNINPLLIDLIKKILTKDPSQRITINQIKEDPWFQSFSPPVIDPTWFIYGASDNRSISRSHRSVSLPTSTLPQPHLIITPEPNSVSQVLAENNDTIFASVVPCDHFIPDTSVIEKVKNFTTNVQEIIEAMQKRIFNTASAYYRIAKRMQITEKMAILDDSFTGSPMSKMTCMRQVQIQNKVQSLRNRKLPPIPLIHHSGAKVESPQPITPARLTSGIPFMGVPIMSSGKGNQSIGYTLYQSRRNVYPRKQRAASNVGVTSPKIVE